MNIDHSSPFADEKLFVDHINLYENLIKIIENDKDNESLNIYER